MAQIIQGQHLTIDEAQWYIDAGAHLVGNYITGDGPLRANPERATVVSECYFTTDEAAMVKFPGLHESYRPKELPIVSEIECAYCGNEWHPDKFHPGRCAECGGSKRG